MKKFITIIVAFMSVLTLWGQTDEDKYINDRLLYFQQNKDEVIRQAEEKGLIQAEDSALIVNVINNAEYLYNNYNNIAAINNTLSSEIERELTNFCKTYSKNITSTNGESISIGTKKFLETIREYQTHLKKLHEQVEESLSSSSPAADGDDNSDDNNNGPDNPIQNESSMSLLYVLVILSLIIGISAVILSVMILNEVKKTNKEAKKPQTNTSETTDIKVRYKKPQKKQTQVQARVQATYKAPVTAPQEPTYPPQQPVQYNNNVAITPPAAPERKENVNKAPQETYLYANTNANGGIEFYKVTTENSGNKVFMIILRKADDENGDFTIAPMSDNFMRDAIVDRNTYLPPLFCESTLDSSNPSRIEVEAKGKAKKVGGKWQMQERMKIRLI